MSRIAYVDGRYVPHRAAAISVDDRGFLFGDGVYEVVEIHRGALIEERRHLARLMRSLTELRLRTPISPAALKIVIREIVARNRIGDGLVYIQVTRGTARRDHAFPADDVTPGLFVAARPIDPRVNAARAQTGVSVISLRDERWSRPDIKSLQLLPNVLAKQLAREGGHFEAWLVDGQGFVTEGASTNAWIVTADGRLATRQTDTAILAGVTRATLIDVAADLGLALEERPFALAEAFAASEAFLSSATTIVLPVVEIDGRAIGEGKPGAIALALRKRFHNLAARG